MTASSKTLRACVRLAGVAIVVVLAGDHAAHGGQPPAPNAVDLAGSRMYVFVGKTGLGHDHAVVGALQAGTFKLHGVARPATIRAETEAIGTLVRLWGGFAIKQTDSPGGAAMSPRAAQETLTDTLASLAGIRPGDRIIDVVLWRWPPPLGSIVSWGFVGSWAALLSSLHLTGLGWQTGLTPWWHRVRGRPVPKRDFIERGAYRVLRHPVSLSFLGLVWFVPVVTLDRAVLIAVWSQYIFLGSVLKDRRLLHFLGSAYREYQSRVPGYPGMPFGPLARLE